MAKEKQIDELFPQNPLIYGTLTDAEINDLVSRGQLITSNTFKLGCLEASSYDIRVGNKAVLGGEGLEIDLKHNVMELTPGAYGGVISYEKFNLPPNICASIGSKRALSYDGVILLTGATVDPGYQGHLLFGLYNASQKKVIIRIEKKICNVVFQRLNRAPEKQAPSSPELLQGNFPDAFIDRMANMDVLPWMQISERVKQIEQITKEIFDLKQQYADVLKPIKELTENVRSVSKDVGQLASQSREISKDLEKMNDLVTKNGEQISQLTANMGVLQGNVQSSFTRISNIEQSDREQNQQVTKVQTEFGRFKVLVYIFWGILLVLLGAFLPKLFDKIF
jgi:deoxycytidine triphosphate deaminase